MRPLDPRVLPHLRPAARPLIVTVLSGAVGGALVVAQAFAVAALVVRLVSDPAGSGWYTPAWWLAGLVAGRAVAGWVGDVAAARAAGVVGTHLRHTVLQATLDLDAPRLSRTRAGELGLLATRGVAGVEPYLTRYLPALVLAVVLPPLTVAAIALRDGWSAVIVVGTIPLIPVFAVLIGMATQARADRQYQQLSSLAGHFLDVVRGLPTLKLFNRAHHQTSRIREVTERYRRATLATLRLAFASSAALELIATLSVALVAVWVGLRLAAGSVDFEIALVVLLLAPEAYWPLRRVGAEFHAAAEGTATFEAIHTLVQDATTAIRVSAGAGSGPALATGGAPLVAQEDRVDPVPLVLDAVVVHYPGRPEPALTLDHAVVPATGLTALVGPSGSGKSTLLAAILGEVPLSSGSITLAGERLESATWHGLVAQVPQVPWLGGRTLAQTLRIARPEADERALWAALATTSLTDTVSALPEGLDTQLGEDGAGLSAGQRARLSLAMVVLADRPYVLLDEPTAHLDALTEGVLIEVMGTLAQHSTVLVVAHSPAVVAAADQVIEVTGPPLHAPAEAPTGVPADVPADAPADAPADVRADIWTDDWTDEWARSSEPPPVTEASDPLHGATPRLVLAAVLATLASVAGVALTATSAWLITRAAEQPPVLLLMVAIVGVRTFGLARPALRYAERLVSHDVALRLLAVRRARIFDELIPVLPGRLGRRRGDLLASVVDDVDAELDHHLRVRQPILAWIGVGVVAGVIAVLAHPPALLPITAVVVLGGLGGWSWARAGTARSERAFVTARAEVSDRVVETVGAARQLVLWSADQGALRTVRRAGHDLSRATSATTRASATGRAWVVLVSGLGVVATALVCAGAVAEGSLSGPLAALLVLTPLALSEVLSPLPDAGTLAVRTEAARRRLADLAAQPPTVTEPDLPQRLSSAAPDVVWEQLTIGWDRPVVVGLDERVPAGGSLGVVGPSGSGKSTLAAVLTRHVAPMAGRYLLGDQDTADLGSAEVHRHVGLVDDDPYVFGSSLRENLRLAAPGTPDEMLTVALGSAGLAAWFTALPEGLDTMLGDGAARVSGGERARLAVARALLADPQILVLDEPTAHLDRATAEAVTASVLAVRAGRSLIWITHDRVGLDRMERVLDLGHATGSPTVSGRPRPPG